MASVRGEIEAMIGACRHGDVAGVLQRVTTELRNQPWDTACSAFAAHDPMLIGTEVTVRGSTATARVQLSRDGTTHTEEWQLINRGGRWQMHQNPPMLQGSWDHDGHHWLGQESLARSPSSTPVQQPTSPTAPAPRVDHYVGDGHDHGTATTMTHFPNDGHPHAAEPMRPGA
jgi:hypothetical protein